MNKERSYHEQEEKWWVQEAKMTGARRPNDMSKDKHSQQQQDKLEDTKRQMT